MFVIDSLSDSHFIQTQYSKNADYFFFINFLTTLLTWEIKVSSIVEAGNYYFQAAFIGFLYCARCEEKLKGEDKVKRRGTVFAFIFENILLVGRNTTIFIHIYEK